MKKKATKVLKQITFLILLLTATKCTDTTQYTLTDDDVVVKNGIIQSCSYDFTYKDIIIPDTLDGQMITGIADKSWSEGVFYDKGITSLVLPATITTIGDRAFSYNSLTSLNLSACTALSSIGNGAFELNSLTSLDLSACTALSFIGDNACAFNSLTSLDLSACTGLDSIGDDAFNKNFLTSLDLSACTDLSFIGSNAFSRNSLTSLDLSACTDLSFIGLYSFSNNSLTSLDLSACTALSSIEHGAFSRNFLSEINLPRSIKSIGAAAFNRNEINKVNGTWSGGIIYARNGDATTDSSTIVSYGGASKSVIVPSHVKKIVSFAFSENSLTSLDLSACTALTSIENGAFWNSYLTEFTLPPLTITGYYWYDYEGNKYAGAAKVRNLKTSYKANLTGILNVTFTITDGRKPIKDATVNLIGYGTVTTNVSGIAAFEQIIPAKDIAYTILATNYDEVSATVSVIDKDVRRDVNLNSNRH